MVMSYEELIRSRFFPVGDEDPSPKDGWSVPDSSPVFKYLFDKHKSLLDDFKGVPSKLVFDLVNQLTEPFLGEYAETTDSPEFLEICSEFYKALFWGDKVYITYEDIQEVIDTAVITIDEEEIEKTLASIQLPKGKSLQMWYMEGLNENDEMYFYHLLTGLTMQRPNWKEEMIEVTWNGLKDNNRFSNWFTLAYKMCINQQSIDLLTHLCTKRILINTDIKNIQTYKEAIKVIYSNHPFFQTQKNYHLTPMMYVSPGELKEYQFAIHHGWDRMLSELGRVSNTNPKQERLTTGENYKDIVSVANRQRMTLNQLKLFKLKAEAMWGLTMNFAINGIPQRVPMEGDMETATLDVVDIGRASKF